MSSVIKVKLLTFVDLSRNNLSGEIPNEITGMRILNYLNLSRNHLVGNIPTSISTMQSLTSVDFSYNNLSGLVPGTGQFSYFNYTSFLGNPDLCGPYLGPCKDGVGNGTHPAHAKGPLSASLKLLLVIGLLVCSIVFAIAAIIKARSLKKAGESRAWKLTAFQRLTWLENVFRSPIMGPVKFLNRRFGLGKSTSREQQKTRLANNTSRWCFQPF